MACLRIAVVGVGHLGREHARILTGLPDVELVGVADINSDQLQGVARRLNCKAYNNYRPLLHLADAAVIAVPTINHHAIAGEFLRCGIPVLVEKPLAANLQQAEELVALARRHGTLLQVGHIERFNPAWEELQRYLLQPKYVEGTRLGPYTGRCVDVGVVLDLMIHDLDLLLALVQAPVRSVEALGVSVFGGQEDIAHARLLFANGCVANLNASRVHPTVERGLHIWAPEGYTHLDLAERRLTLIQPSEQVRHHGLDPRRLDPASLAILKDELFGRHLEVYRQDCNSSSDALTRELQDFVRCLETGTRPRVSGEDGLEAIALATQVLESIQTHQWEGHSGGTIGPAHLPLPRGRWFRPPADDIAA